MKENNKQDVEAMTRIISPVLLLIFEVNGYILSEC